ncbi:MAG: IS200/IS605 family transposase [Chitinispirillaceae bacterium]|nr:IS200/IS605 family transposase [Chitinispirillaceae bacterium]
MPQSLSQVLIHIVFSTKNRVPLIPTEVDAELYAYLGQICNNHKCPSILINGVANHIHILCGLSRIITIADIVEELKTGTSKWLKTKSPNLAKFSWQNGYGVFSVDWRNASYVKSYIAGQKEHHAKVTFQDEYRRLLHEFNISFDERYVWD